MDKDIAEVAGCICLRLRRTTRRATQIYDHALAPTRLTVNQFGVLANLLGATFTRPAGIAIGELAERLGMDPTTLNRTLKPLQQKRLVKNSSDPADSRVRLVLLTEQGKRAVHKAVPFWREAQTLVRTSLGAKAALLNELLDHSAATLPRSRS